MPSQRLKELVPKREFTHEQWFNLAEERRTMITPFLSRFTLDAFIDVKCLYHDRYNTYSPSEAGISRPTTQAIWNRELPQPLLTRKDWNGMWGLSRNGTWVLVSFQIKREGFREFIEYAAIEETNLVRLSNEFKNVPRLALHLLDQQVHAWYLDHRKLLDKIKALHDIFAEDSELIGLMQA